MSEKKEFTDRFSDFDISDLIFEISLKISPIFLQTKNAKKTARFSGKIKVYYETPSGGYGFIAPQLQRMKTNESE